MPLKVPCPNCRGILTIGEDIQGKTVRCPRCKTIFKAPAEPAGALPPAAIIAKLPEPPEEEIPDWMSEVLAQQAEPASALPPAAIIAKLPEPPEEQMPAWMSEVLAQQNEEEIEEEQEDEQDEEEQQFDREERRGWKLVRSGLVCVLLGTVIPFGAGLVAAIMVVMGKDNIAGAVSLSLIGSVVGGLLTVLGRALCCCVPWQAGGKVLAGLATGLTFIAMALGMYLTFSSLEEAAPGQQHQRMVTLLWVSSAYLIASVFGMFCWLLFLHTICSYFRAHGPSVSVIVFGALGVTWAIFVAVTLFESKPQDLITRKGEASSELLGMAGGLLALLLFYVCLLGVVASVVGRQIKKR